jgi:hypothetical protein
MTNPPGAEGFPSKDIPDSGKDEQYVLKFLKAMHRTFCSYPMYGQYGAGGMGVAGTETMYAAPWMMQRYRDFSRALNTGDKMRKAHQLNDGDANGAQTAMKIHWDPSLVQWKPMNLISSMLAQRDTELVATPLDPTSVDRRTRERYRKLSRIHTAQDNALKGAASMMGVDMAIPADQPQTEEEFLIWEAMGPKDAAATSLTLAVSLMHLKSDYRNRVRTRLSEELRDTGIGIVTVDTSPAGLPIAKVIRVEDAVLPWFDDNARDLPWAGYIEFKTPEEVLAKVGRAWGGPDSAEYKEKKRQLYDLAKSGASDGRVFTDPLGSYSYRRAGRVPVFTGFFKDINHFPVSSRKGKGGRKVYASGEKGGKWTTDRYCYEVVYKGSLVIGTHDSTPGGGERKHCLHWGCGLAYNQPRMMDDLYTTRIPMVVRAYGMTEMRNRSVAHVAMVKCLEIEELTIKIRDFIRKMVPPGLGKINIDALTLAMTDLNVTAEAKVALAVEMFSQTGSVPYKETDNEDPVNTLKRSEPFSPHAGLIPDLERLASQLSWHKNEFYETIGLNDALLGNQAPERTSATSLKMQAAGGQSALNFLYSTFDEIEEQVALVEYGILQCTMQEGFVLEGMSRLLGDPAEKYVRFASEDDPGSIGIEAVMHLTDEQRYQINEALDKAITAGAIDPVDKAIILKVKNFDLALRMLRSRMDIKARKAHERQQQLVQQQSEGNMQAVQAQAGVKKEETAMLAEIQASLQQLKGQQEIDKINAKAGVESSRDERAMVQEMHRMMVEMQEDSRQLQMKLEAGDRMNMRDNRTREVIAEEAIRSNEQISREANESREEVASKRPPAAKE